jgi:hypothetical protein
VKELVRPLIEKQIVFKEAIVEKVSGTVNPFLADKGASLLKPVMDVLFKPVADAFTYAVQDFHSHLTSKIKEGVYKKGDSDYNYRLDYTDWEMVLYLLPCD